MMFHPLNENLSEDKKANGISAVGSDLPKLLDVREVSLKRQNTETRRPTEIIMDNKVCRI